MLVVLGWFSIQIVVMYFSDAAPGAVALFPARGFVANLPENVAVVAGGAYWVAVKSDAPNLGPSLYSAGARIVLPAGLPGCLPLR